MSVTEDTWTNCYGEGWKGLCVAETFKHPAKYSRALIGRIYEHLTRGEGWLHAGDQVLDPFGGVALGALDAMRHGLNWTGVEIEEPFHTTGCRNLDVWTRDMRAMSNPGTGRLLRGDSRQLSEVLRDAAPAAVVSSPPFGEATSGGGIMRNGYTKRGDPSDTKDKMADRVYGKDQVGTAAGNLGRMKVGDVDAVLSSPPYEGSAESGKRHGLNGVLGRMAAESAAKGKNGQPGRAGMQAFRYSEDRQGENLGNMKREEFWTNARIIVHQVHGVLRPGGIAVWVVKDMVKDGARLPITESWRRLCEAVGFHTLHVHRALLSETKREQLAIGGGVVEETTERKSFFRRLHERKGSPRVDWETVLCMVRT